MVSPYGCWGRPHDSCLEGGIPIIYVKENRTILNTDHLNMPPYGLAYVENYWEAAGYIMAMKAGVRPQSVRSE